MDWYWDSMCECECKCAHFIFSIPFSFREQSRDQHSSRGVESHRVKNNTLVPSFSPMSFPLMNSSSFPTYTSQVPMKNRKSSIFFVDERRKESGFCSNCTRGKKSWIRTAQETKVGRDRIYIYLFSGSRRVGKEGKAQTDSRYVNILFLRGGLSRASSSLLI